MTPPKPRRFPSLASMLRRNNPTLADAFRDLANRHAALIEEAASVEKDFRLISSRMAWADSFQEASMPQEDGGEGGFILPKGFEDRFPPGHGEEFLPERAFPLAPLMNESEAAAFLCLKPKTLRNWRSTDRGPVYYKFGDSKGAPVAYAVADLLAYASRHKVCPNE